MAKKETCSHCPNSRATRSAYCIACRKLYSDRYNASKRGKAANCAWVNRRRHEDRSYRLGLNFRIEIGQMLRDGYARPKTLEILGCTYLEFVAHIAASFRAGMDWSNRGRRGWWLHYRTPFKGVDCTDINQLKLVGHYTNITPEWPHRLPAIAKPRQSQRATRSAAAR